MKKIYLTGAVSDFDDPFKWHDEAKDDWDEYEFVNPYTLNNFEMGDEDIYDRPHEVVEPAEEEVADADGLLVRWDDDVFLVGSAMEIKHANDHGIPVSVWYDGWRDNLSPWILDKTLGQFDTRDKAMKVLLMNLGEADAVL